MVRLTDEQHSALQSIADETGQDVAKLLRYGAEALIKHYKLNGNRLVLPIDFGEVVQVLRSAAAEHKKSGDDKSSKAA